MSARTIAIVILAPILGLTAASHAADAAPDLDALIDCRQIPRSEQRARCYDELVDAWSDNTTTAAPAGQKKEGMALFGRKKAEKPDEQASKQQPERLRAHITALRRSRSGRHIITLDNDQIWRQTNTGDTLLLHKGDEIEIRKGILGSFLLSKAGRARSIRVERIDD